MAFELTVNSITRTIDADPEVPLLWILREHIGLTGTKYSCGIGQCGACTVHIDGRQIRSCSVPAAVAIGREVTTIEGIAAAGRHPVQQAWIELDAPQCGYCQSGMIMATLSLLAETPTPTDADIDRTITNICRCSSYHRVRQAIHRAADLMAAESTDMAVGSAETSAGSADMEPGTTDALTARLIATEPTPNAESNDPPAGRS